MKIAEPAIAAWLTACIFFMGWSMIEQHRQTAFLATIAEQTKIPVAVKLDGFSDEARDTLTTALKQKKRK